MKIKTIVVLDDGSQFMYLADAREELSRRISEGINKLAYNIDQLQKRYFYSGEGVAEEAIKRQLRDDFSTLMQIADAQREYNEACGVTDENDDTPINLNSK